MDDTAHDRHTNRTPFPRYWGVTAILLGLIVLAALNITSTIGRMEARNALMGPFLECVERNGGSFTTADHWMKAGGRPIIVSDLEVTAADRAIHETCWEQVQYIGP